MSIRDISEYMSDEHNRLQGMFSMFRTIKAEDHQKSTDLLHAIMAGLRRYIEWEESILIPILEDRLGMKDRGPSAVLQEEHRKLEILMQSVHDCVTDNQSERDRIAKDLIQSLDAHNQNAKDSLYSMLDHSLNESEKLQVYQKMKGVPLSKDNSCCEKG